MHYHQVSIISPPEYLEAISAELMRLGSLGLVENEQGITAYFPGDRAPAQLKGALDILKDLIELADRHARIGISMGSLEGKDWNESWKKNFVPLPVGKRFVILPPWETAPPGRTPLVIDPGMAFGTGHHETTRSCIILIERYAGEVGRERFLDLGTGTGLLAIAALHLGFRHVEGVDTDPLAIEAARMNVTLNHASAIRLAEGGLDAATGTFDMIAANLISGTLVSLADGIARRTRQGGMAVLSGILRGQEDEVLGAMADAGMDCRERLEDGKWVALACRR